MSLMTLAQAHALLSGSTMVGDGATAIQRVHTDTRSLQAGDLFVALRGETFDAHDFLPQARQAGASAVVASRGDVVCGLLVPDTLVALQALSKAWRHRFHLPLVAVAGSNGKTTVTQMVASILRAWHGAGSLATAGNYNNHIGVPLTLLRLRQDDAVWHRAAVVELGMNHPGEIAELAALAQPTVALVNNAQREHQEFMASVAAVAQENGSVFASLPASGVAVFPADDSHTTLWHHMAGARRVVTFGAQPLADVAVEGAWQAAHAAHAARWRLKLTMPDGAIQTTLALPGVHNLLNAAAAAACAWAAGAPATAVAQGLADFEPVKGRLQTHAICVAGQSAALIDDTYNANPDSARAAIDVLAAMPAPRWLVLGDMGEVGSQGPAFHDEVGRYAQTRGIEHFWCAGALSVHAAQAFGAQAQHFVDTPALVSALASSPACASVLVKGSRFMAMERVVAALRAVKSRAGATAC